jgi:hypothetical protein
MTKKYKYTVEKNCDHTYYFIIQSDTPLIQDDIEDCINDADTREWGTVDEYKGIKTTFVNDIKETVNYEIKGEENNDN